MLLRGKAAASYAAAAAGKQPSTVKNNSDYGIPTMMHVQAVAGAHHFSASWTGWANSIDKSNNTISKVSQPVFSRGCQHVLCFTSIVTLDVRVYIADAHRRLI